MLEQFEKELKINQVLQSNMAHVSQSLVKSSTDLNKTMEQMIHFGGHVDDQVRGINASVEESNGISESMVKRFSDFNNDTETMYGQMASTQEMVFQNIELSAKVEKNVNLLYVSLSELVEEAKEISKTTATINHISENIKLLALNATIEASRAGESGKGFAVVASEVQKLSVQSELATARVAKGIQRISKDITVMTEGMSLLSEDGQRLNQSSLTMKQLCSDLDLLINSIKNQTNTITIQIKDEDFAINNIGKMTELLAADSLNLSRYINESKKAITETEGLVMTLEQHMNKQEVVVL